MSIVDKIMEAVELHRPGHSEYTGGWWELACEGCSVFHGKRLSHLNWGPHKEHLREVLAEILDASPSCGGKGCNFDHFHTSKEPTMSDYQHRYGVFRVSDPLTSTTPMENLFFDTAKRAQSWIENGYLQPELWEVRAQLVGPWERL